MDISFALILSLTKYCDVECAKNFDYSVDDMTSLFPENCKLKYIIIIYLPFLDFRLKIQSLLK